MTESNGLPASVLVGDLVMFKLYCTYDKTWRRENTLLPLKRDGFEVRDEISHMQSHIAKYAYDVF